MGSKQARKGVHTKARGPTLEAILSTNLEGNLIVVIQVFLRFVMIDEE